jgi:hypothetical protein
MTHADNGTMPLGTSRDTDALGVAPPPTTTPPAQPVILRVWGCTPTDATSAENTARDWPHGALWDIVEVIPSYGMPCPIPPRDPLVLQQGADYDRAWAAYPARIAR